MSSSGPFAHLEIASGKTPRDSKMRYDGFSSNWAKNDTSKSIWLDSWMGDELRIHINQYGTSSLSFSATEVAWLRDRLNELMPAEPQTAEQK
jgi:hypothetical protein